MVSVPRTDGRFSLDEKGLPRFGHGHALTFDLAKRNQARVEEDGRIWDSTVFEFGQAMIPDSLDIELLDVTDENRGQKANVLQIYVQYVPRSSHSMFLTSHPLT